jgi:2-alkyl-3-oxoalkanoate reductase
MRIAITGCTGGIGRRLALAALSRGDIVMALVRDVTSPAAVSLERAGVALVKGDLGCGSALRELLRNADVAAHLAALVGDTGPVSEFQRVNVEGTRNVLDAAADSGVQRYLQLSSTAVYGRPARGLLTEASPTRPSGHAYDDSKEAAERLAFSHGKKLGLHVTAIRPPLVYGPHDRHFIPRIIGALRRKRVLLVDQGRAPFNMVWVDHVVDLALKAAVSPAAVGEAFNVTDADDTTPTVRAVLHTIARAASLPPPPNLSVPYPIAMAGAAMISGAYRYLSPTTPPPVTPFAITALTSDVVYDATKARRLLGWKPRLTTLDGIAREVSHYVASLHDPQFGDVSDTISNTVSSIRS